MNNKSSSLPIFLLLGIAGIFIMPFITSCGKSTTIPAGAVIQFQVLNLSPDILPVDLYIDFTKYNTNSFTYPNASGYFSLRSIDMPFQIRASSTNVSTVNFLSLDTLLKNNVKYSLFITGFRADNSVTSIFTIDTSATPIVGRGKVRFVNASPGSTFAFDVTANGTAAFNNQVYKNVSSFIEVPAGNYDFKIFPTGTSTGALSDLPGVTIQDGKLYTLYCKGVVGRLDSAAFSMAVINNSTQ